MSTTDLAGARWRLSSYTGSGGPEGGSCVEVAALPAGSVAVRDSKDRGGAVLRHPGAAWQAFVAGVKGGEFDR